jgi:hypothetical protein
MSAGFAGGWGPTGALTGYVRYQDFLEHRVLERNDLVWPQEQRQWPSRRPIAH